ncbi:MAG: hypothetical protein ACRCSU_10190 [Paracoccaceae bacterium]
MNRLARTALVIAAVAGAVYVLFYPTKYQWRQKLTLTVETPAGEVSGASVTEVFTRRVAKILPEAGSVKSSFHGEAIVVEVVPGRYLFALISNGLGWVDEPYGTTKVGSTYEENMRFIMNQIGKPPVPMPEESLPILVTFDNINDPATVREVDPKNLAASFGPGVRLKSVTIRITDEPVTEGRVEALLNWLGPYPEPAIAGTSTGLPIDQAPLYRRITVGDFIRRQR